MSHHIITCKNCKNQYDGHFCNNCGQKAATYKIDLKHLLHDFLHALTHLDKGILFTLKQMLLRPGHTVREYLEGKRVRHSNPLLLLLIIGGFCSLAYSRFELKLVSSYKISELDGGLHAIDSKFFAILFIGYCLIFSLIDLILFKYKKYNYTEYFLLNVFISIEILTLQLCLVPLWLLGHGHGINNYLRVFIGFLFMAYLVYVRYQFFEVENDPKAKKRLIIAAIFYFAFAIFFNLKTYYGIFGSS